MLKLDNLQVQDQIIGYNIDPDDNRTNKEIDEDLDNYLKERGIKSETIELDERPEYLK